MRRALLCAQRRRQCFEPVARQREAAPCREQGITAPVPERGNALLLADAVDDRQIKIQQILTDERRISDKCDKCRERFADLRLSGKHIVRDARQSGADRRNGRGSLHEHGKLCCRCSVLNAQRAEFNDLSGLAVETGRFDVDDRIDRAIRFGLGTSGARAGLHIGKTVDMDDVQTAADVNDGVAFALAADERARLARAVQQITVNKRLGFDSLLRGEPEFL